MVAWHTRVSILIVSWQRADLLAQCVQSLTATAAVCSEIVIVDNGSMPPLQPIPGTTWIRSEENRGFAGGNNLGLPHCSGEYILLLNNDTRLPDLSPIETLAAFLDNHPHVAIAQAKLSRPDGTLDTCGEFLTPWGVLYHHGYCQPDGAHTQSPFPIYAAKGACCLIRKSALSDVGHLLFREDYFCYGEDIELCHRLWLAGWEVWFVPTAPVAHLECATSSTLPSRTIWRHYLSNLLATACSYWSLRLWLLLGPGLLLFLCAGALLKGVLPLRRQPPPTFIRRRNAREFLKQTLVCVPPTYWIQCFTRRFHGLYR
ncbi:MAG: glycosyltransferase family 2 protein [Kiritimatiellae bacterium]|nr:glycosyltransferase family 2 protein [Kiritimatiellia bacterium]